MLSERHERLSVRLDTASHADERLAQAKHTAASEVRKANAEARKVVADARVEAEAFEAKAAADADTEARRVEERAESALANELAEMHIEVREELVDLVAGATRSIMNEKMSVAEQRKLIEGAIACGVEKARPKEPAVPKRATGPTTAAGAV